MQNIINPYGMLEENIEEINFCWRGLIETGEKIYLSRLNAVVDDAERRLNKLTAEERRIVGEIMDNKRKAIFDGSYVGDLREFMNSFWDDYDPEEDVSEEEYIRRRCISKSIERRMKEMEEDFRDARKI